MNMLTLWPELNQKDKEAIAYAVRNCEIDLRVESRKFRQPQHRGYKLVAKLPELALLDRDYVMKALRYFTMQSNHGNEYCELANRIADMTQQEMALAGSNQDHI